jgi:hypothetical protein
MANWLFAALAVDPILALTLWRSVLLILDVTRSADSLLHGPSWFEGDDQPGRDVYWFPSARVTAFPGLAFLDLEDAEIAEFDTAFQHQRLDDPVQDTLDDCHGLRSGKA